MKDSQEGIGNIEWTVYGKIARITKTNGTEIRYGYDVSGNRITKAVTSGGLTNYTSYVRDASGNVMTVYEQAGGSTVMKATEQHLYGSGRVGLWQKEQDIDLAKSTTSNVNLLGPAYIVNFSRGNKLFELSNHLGNVLVTVSDKKLIVSANGTTIDYYTADVATANDYYPFGMLQPGRRYSASGSYRYGFNGQEKSIEINSDGNSMTAEFWQYDARIGRRWNVDPVMKENESPYGTFSNNPIFNIDPKGNSDSTYKTPGRGTLTVESTTAQTYDGNSYRVGKGGAIITPAKGTLRSFSVPNGGEPGETSRFIAAFDKESGVFTGFVWDGNMKDSYELFCEARDEDLADQRANEGNPLYQHYTNRRDALNSAINLNLGVALPNVAIKPLTIAVNTQKILSKLERLNIFKSKLLSAPAAKSAEDALKLINKTMDKVEDVYSGVAKNVKAAMTGANDGRMYGVLDEKFVTRHANGAITALTKGHKIEIQANGSFTIFDSKGNLFLTK